MSTPNVVPTWLSTTVAFAQGSDGDTVRMMFGFLTRGYGVRVTYTSPTAYAAGAYVDMYADAVVQDEVEPYDMYVVGRRMTEDGDDTGEVVKVPLHASIITVY
jgi:hypothetical protein